MSGSDKQKVAFNSAIASFLLTLLKLIVGLLTGSLAIFAEAAHSALDLSATLLTYFAVRAAEKPADEAHNYGHGKVESVTALFEAGLLTTMGGFIIWEAVHRLIGNNVAQVAPEWYAFAVMIVSIAVDWSRSHALNRVAKETGSQALKADALHFTLDMLSSLAVLIGLGLAYLGWNKGDAAAALAVSGVILGAALHLGREAFAVLIDASPEGASATIRSIVLKVSGVARVSRLRVRSAGGHEFVEVTIMVSRTLPLAEAEDIAARVRQAIVADYPRADVVVNTEPLALTDETVAETVRVTADRMRMSVHDISVHQEAGSRHVAFDLEVDDFLSLSSAHARATALEHAILQELGNDVVVVTHIDPRRPVQEEGEALSDEQRRDMEDKVKAIAVAEQGIHNPHLISVRRIGGSWFISLHCTFPDNASIRDVHAVTARLEQRLREHLPDVANAVIHAEPESEG